MKDVREPRWWRASLYAAVGVLTVVCLAVPSVGWAQGALPSIEQKTAGMTRMDGFFPLYWEESAGKLWMEISRFDTEVLYFTGLASGLGSNDIGLDRADVSGTHVVEFERVGPKVKMVQPNYEYRATSTNPAEVRAVQEGFARSVLWGFTVAAESGNRVLVDLTDFLMRDATALSERLRPGSYRFDASRSSVYMPMTMNFPENTEVETEVTFVLQPGTGGGPRFGFGGRGAFEGVADVAADWSAASLRVHHSFVELPDDGYTPRAYDPRGGFGSVSYADYSTPLGEPMSKRLIRRHRLEKVDPSAAVSDAVEPIVYYLDPGVPEPIRSALMEGASWWNQAFGAAGYRNAFRVELLPEGVSHLDIRYNIINWVHRSTRGWSSGGGVTDPRTGEIIKGAVTLGSSRIRQDYMIAQGLLSPYDTGDEAAPELAEWALARIRQLAAHEVGHTLGLGHNYYDSDRGRISVMDYPHPLVTLRGDGSFDYSDVYEHGIGEWDSVTITWGYQDFPQGTDEQGALRTILDDAWGQDIRYQTNQDASVHPRVDQWSNGTDAGAELNRIMDYRSVALSRFGESAVKRGTPLALMEEVLVPLYLHHRYQVTAAASALGGLHYIYAMRGDGREPFRRASGNEQRSAMDALARTLAPSELSLPSSLLNRLPPRPTGFGRHRELFPRYTGMMFDGVTPAVVAADHTVSEVLDVERAARLVEQHAIDGSLPGLEEVIDRLFDASFGAAPANEYQAEVNRAVERVVVDRVMSLAASAPMPQVRAVATMRLERQLAWLKGESGEMTQSDAAHYGLLARDIERFLERPADPYTAPEASDAPPGAPIGEPAMDWLGVGEPERVWDEGGGWW